MVKACFQCIYGNEDELQRLEAGYAPISTVAVGGFSVQQVWLVHYANRTLNRIVGKIPLRLGQANQLTVGQLLGGLRVV